MVGPTTARSTGLPGAHQNFGTVIVSCERADLRPLPSGVMIYRDDGSQLDALPPPDVPRAEVIDELYDAIVEWRRAASRWALGHGNAGGLPRDDTIEPRQSGD